MTEDFERIELLEMVRVPAAQKSNLFLIDTNILVYAYEKENSIKNDRAKNLLDECLTGAKELSISNQNLAEFVWVSTRKGKLNIVETNNFVTKAINFLGFKKINYSAKTVASALDIVQEFKMPFWDALLAATMRENGIFNIYTENAKDFKMPWINAVNPFT